MVRVSKQVKRETRQAILTASKQLFRKQGFAETTTRDLAAEAGIAAGTLFNYFPTKEALLVELAAEELSAAHGCVTAEVAKFDGSPDKTAPTLDEDLFSLIAAGLRRLKPLRKYLAPALAMLSSPLSKDPSVAAVREQHLGIVASLTRAHGIGEPDEVGLQMYWTLYTGVLAHWSEDTSPRQEDTWALLDQSMQMYVHWLQSPQATE